MQIVRFSASNEIRFGIVENNIVRSYAGSPFKISKEGNDSFIPDGDIYDINRLKLLAPCLPSKIVCLGINYRTHADEFKSSLPSVPLIFLKPSTAIIGPEDEIVLPRDSRRVDYEGELAIVIDRKAKNIAESEVNEYILGYTCFNDVTERHNQKSDGQWTRGKGYDTFAPMGPCIVTDIDPDDLKLETFLNGELRQSARTSDLIFGVPQMVSFISNIMTLLPGDVIATGTTSGVGKMEPGDVVGVKIEKIGNLKNFVVKQN